MSQPFRISTAVDRNVAMKIVSKIMYGLDDGRLQKMSVDDAG